MKKSQLKRAIKPIVEECITEVLLEKGLLSNIISEVVKGIQPLQQSPMQQRPVMQENKLMQQQRQELQEQKYEMMKAQKRKLLDAAGFGVDVFSGTEPIEEAADPSNGQAGALSGVAPNDAGVDIAGIMAVANRDWSKNDLEVIMGKKRPINVEVKPRHRDEPVEKLIRRFTKKVKNERVIEKVLSRKRYEKPSVKRRREKLRKKRLIQKLNRERQLREEQRQK